MEKYDYLAHMKEDIRAYLAENYDQEELKLRVICNIEDLEEDLHDELWTEDSVTGNACGSYTCDTWTAEEYICHNWDLINDLAREFGEPMESILSRGAEAVDVEIRCYLLGQAVSAVLSDLEKEVESTLERKCG